MIESRLAQLSEGARRLAGIAATIGREFTTEVLGAASQTEEEELVRGLDELWRRLVRESWPDAYDFTHDRLREGAYLALSPARRRRAHLSVSRALERLHAEDPAAVAGQLVMHYDRAGAVEEAVPWYGWAAGAAQRLYAADEAVRLLERGLELLAALPATRERQMRRLALLTALPAPLGLVEGYGSRRIAEVQHQGLRLARTLRVEPAPSMVRSAGVSSLSRGDFEEAIRMGEVLRERGERDADAVRAVEGAYVLGIAAFWRGEFEAARKHFGSAVEGYRGEHRTAHLVRFGQDPKVVCLSRLANTRWFLGRPRAAVRARDAALALAEDIGHPHSRDVAVVFAALLDLELGDLDRLREGVTRSRTATTRRPRRPWSRPWPWPAISTWWTDGPRPASRGSGRLWRSQGAQTTLPGCVPRSPACWSPPTSMPGRPAACSRPADRALELSHAVRTWTSEVRRVRGEALAALGAPSPDVEEEFEIALDLARRQGARMLELRAAVSLVRYRAERGDAAGAMRARDLLAEVVKALPEADQTRELRKASALLVAT